MLIKILYAVLVIATIALIGAVIAAYLRVRKHMREPAKPPEQQTSTDRTTND